LSCGERITGYTLEMRNTLAFAAAVTERVRIVPSLYVLPMHSAVWAAKEIATLDLLSNGRVTVTVGGMAKGAGMIAPSLAPLHATMLAFFTTDATIDRATLDRALIDAVGPTFNRITVDSDTSTNDTAIVLANRAGPRGQRGPRCVS
jgi:N-acetylglutamate synthase/N-acetylornithine aminotransferase